MSCNSNSPNVNKTFIIEPLSITGGSPTLSACTTLYTNLVKSCSGDTTIQMGTGLVTFNSNVNGINSFTANTIEATTYLSGGTNILDIINTNDTFITGGTFSNISDSITLSRNDGANVIITGLTNYYVTGGTYNNNTGLITFNRNDSLSAFTIDLNSLDLNDTFITGFTYNNINTFTISRNRGLSDLTSTISVLSGVTYYGDGSNLSGVNIRSTDTLTTTDDSSNIISTLSNIEDNTTTFIENYVTCHNSFNNYGFWKRTIAINKNGGSIDITRERADFDSQSSGLTPTNIVYSSSSGNLLILVTGESGKTYNWVSKWEII